MMDQNTPHNPFGATSNNTEASVGKSKKRTILKVAGILVLLVVSFQLGSAIGAVSGSLESSGSDKQSSETTEQIAQDTEQAQAQEGPEDYNALFNSLTLGKSRDEVLAELNRTEPNDPCQEITKFDSQDFKAYTRCPAANRSIGESIARESVTMEFVDDKLTYVEHLKTSDSVDVDPEVISQKGTELL